MTVNTKWCRQHPEDTGLTVHEMAHVIQAFTAYNPVWLVEGVADYVRWIKFEPENYHVRINPKTATYHDAYRTTATFLGWLELHYDSRLVSKLNEAVRFGKYKTELFKQYCGKDVDALWTEFIAAYQADPVHIITPPTAAADRPRLLPGRKTRLQRFRRSGKGVQQRGRDGGRRGVPGGKRFDGGGAAYSSALLGAAQTWKGVSFRLGPAGAANIVSCRGAEIALPAGNYASLWLLGAAVEGSQMGADFCRDLRGRLKRNSGAECQRLVHAAEFPRESRALKMTYRNMAGGDRDTRTFYVYTYGFRLDSAKAVKSITLPDNANVKLLAVTLAH